MRRGHGHALRHVLPGRRRRRDRLIERDPRLVRLGRRSQIGLAPRADRADRSSEDARSAHCPIVRDPPTRMLRRMSHVDFAPSDRSLARRQSLALLSCLRRLAPSCTRLHRSAAQRPQPPPPQVTVADVVARDVTEWDEFTGRLEAGGHRRHPAARLGLRLRRAIRRRRHRAQGRPAVPDRSAAVPGRGRSSARRADAGARHRAARRLGAAARRAAARRERDVARRARSPRRVRAPKSTRAGRRRSKPHCAPPS